MIFKGLHKDFLLHSISVLILCIILVMSFLANTWVEYSSKVDVEKSLKTALDSAQQGLRLLFQNQQAPALLWANDDRVRHAVQRLIQVTKTRDALLLAPEQGLLRSLFNPYLGLSGFKGFFIIAEDGTSLASSRDQNVGSANLLKQQGNFLRRVWNGETLISQPVTSDIPLMEQNGRAPCRERE